MAAQIKQVARSCEVCRTLNPDTLSRVFVPWPEPSAPFERVHIDFFHLESRNFLLLVDAFSRWVEITHMRRTDTTSVITALSVTFTRFGDPKLLVSDNGPPFNLAGFARYCDLRGIKLLHSPLYHPQSNGSAERWVRLSL